jgi:hypothetical protein
MPVAIPENSPVTVDRVLTGAQILTSVAVCVNIDHPWIGDLDVRLIHDGGTSIIMFLHLAEQNGGCQGGGLGMHAYISDGSDPQLLDTCETEFLGFFSPMQPFVSGEGTFQDETVGGTWTLRVLDDKPAHPTGSITGFEVYVQ